MNNSKSILKQIIFIPLVIIFIIGFIITYLILKPNKSLVGGDVLSSITFSPDSKCLLSFIDSTLIVQDVNTNKIIKSFPVQKSGLKKVVFSPDGKYILSASLLSSRTLLIYDFLSGEKRVLNNPDDDLFTDFSFSSDGNYLVASGPGFANPKLWDLSTGKEKKDYWKSNVLDFSSDGLHLISMASNRHIELWNIRDKEKVRSYKVNNNFYNAYFSFSGKHIIISYNNGFQNYLFSLKKPYIDLFEVENASRYSLSFSSDDNFSVSFSRRGDNEFKLKDIRMIDDYNLYKFRISRLFAGFDDFGIFSAAISPDSKYVAVGVGNEKILLWNIEKYVKKSNRKYGGN